jgi:hypothetical protein
MIKQVTVLLSPRTPVLGLFEVSSVDKIKMAIDVYYIDYKEERIFIYTPRLLPDTLILPRKSGYLYGGMEKKITLIENNQNLTDDEP